MSAHRHLILATLTTSADPDRPSTTNQVRYQSGTMRIEWGGREWLGMVRGMRTESDRVESVFSVQDVQRPYLRKCSTAAQLERLAALRGLAEPITAARVEAELGWSPYEAKKTLEDLSARGYLRAEGRAGHRWTAEGRAA